MQSKLRSLQSSPPSFQGANHLFTGCGTGYGVVGIAYVGTICIKGYNCGVNQLYNQNSWLTFAHELGHNFDGKHSFEEGQGDTGGIMDYGDGKLKGVYQFNRKYREQEMCAEMKKAVGSANNEGWCWVKGTTSQTASPTAKPAPTSSPTSSVPRVKNCGKNDKHKNCAMWAGLGDCDGRGNDNHAVWFEMNCGPSCCTKSGGSFQGDAVSYTGDDCLVRSCNVCSAAKTCAISGCATTRKWHHGRCYANVETAVLPYSYLSVDLYGVGAAGVLVEGQLVKTGFKPIAFALSEIRGSLRVVFDDFSNDYGNGQIQLNSPINVNIIGGKLSVTIDGDLQIELDFDKPNSFFQGYALQVVKSITSYTVFGVTMI